MASTCLGTKSVAASSRSSARRGVSKPLRLSEPCARRGHAQKTICMAASIAAEDVPDMNKRVLLNWMLVGTSSVPILLMAGPYFSFFVPKGCVTLLLKWMTNWLTAELVVLVELKWQRMLLAMMSQPSHGPRRIKKETDL